MQIDLINCEVESDFLIVSMNGKPYSLNKNVKTITTTDKIDGTVKKSYGSKT
jgi:hypothetical protein